jgi:hypothetical protein
VNDSAKVSFTAYKTTDKSVRGVFKEITLTNTRQGETALDALNGAQFIPVNSLFTNDATGSRS